MVCGSNLSNSTLWHKYLIIISSTETNVSCRYQSHRLGTTKETIQPNQDPATSVPFEVKNQCSYDIVSLFVSFLGVPVVDLSSKVLWCCASCSCFHKNIFYVSSDLWNALLLSLLVYPRQAFMTENGSNNCAQCWWWWSVSLYAWNYRGRISEGITSSLQNFMGSKICTYIWTLGWLLLVQAISGSWEHAFPVSSFLWLSASFKSSSFKIIWRVKFRWIV